MASGDVNTGGSTTTPNSPQVTKTSDMLLKGLRSAYSDGVDVYGKPLYRDPSATTENAWSRGTGFATDLIGAGGFAPGQKRAMDSLGGVFGGYGSLTDNGGLTAGQSDAVAGIRGLGDTYGDLSTAFDPNSDAYRTLRAKVANDTLTDVASLGASNGRYGAKSFNEGAAQGLGEALAGLDYTNMSKDIDNRYRAADAKRALFGDAFGMDQTGTGNILAGLGGQAATAGQQFGMGQTALGNKGNAIGLLGQVGAAQDADRLAKRQANADLFEKQNNGDWEALARASSILGGTAGASGSTTSNSVPWWAALLGGAATGASVLG
jgi:hypothetical protein